MVSSLIICVHLFGVVFYRLPNLADHFLDFLSLAYSICERICEKGPFGAM